MLAPARRIWNLENFTEVTRIEGGDAAVAVLRHGLDWAESHGGGYNFIGDGPYAPLSTSGSRTGMGCGSGSSPSVPVASALCTGASTTHPPYDQEAERRKLTDRLNEVHRHRYPAW